MANEPGHPRKQKARPLRNQQYPVAQPYRGGNPPPPPVALPASAPPLPTQTHNPGRGWESPLPPWFMPLTKGLGLVTLAMACMLAGWLALRGQKTTTPSTGIAKLGPADTKAPAAEPPKEKQVKEPAKKKESPAPPPKTEDKPDAKPDATARPEPKPKTEPKPEPPTTTPAKPTPATPATANLTFDKDVLPIFKAKCVACHGDTKKKGGLDVRTVAALLKGGENGPALKPGSLERSLLWESISTDQMPPSKNNKLSQAEKKIVQSWITQGKDIVK